MREIIYLIALLSGMCDGVYKYWKEDTNFGNPLNWDAGRAPCGSDVAIIPEGSPIVFVQMDTSIRQLVLSHEGKLLFGSDMTLAFRDTQNEAANCPGSSKDVKFNALQAPAWMDPLNWCQIVDEHTDCQQIHMLDSQKIPGTHDNVVFSGQKSFFADLGTGMNITVSTLKIWSESFTSETFSDFLRTSDGQKMFPTTKNAQQRIVTIQREECTDSTGCATGNDIREIMDEICKFEKPRCLRPKCNSPVLPNGHCCKLCGAVLTLRYDNGFQLKKLIDKIQTNLQDQNDSYADVVFIASKMSDATIQLVLTDDDGQRSGQAADMVKSNINSDIENLGIIYKISSLEWKKSGSPIGSDKGKYSGSDSVSSGEIAGIIVGLIAVVGFVALGVILVYRRNRDNFRFKLFKQFSLPRRHERSRNEDSPTGPLDLQVPETLRPSDQAFENPMFGNSTFDNDRYFNLTPTEGSAQSQPGTDESGSFVNPLYDVQMEESVFDDPVKVLSTDKMKVEATEETSDA